jgi:hypothetical protein
MQMGVEDHGHGRQLLHFLCWPTVATEAILLTLLFGALAVAAAWSQAWPVFYVLAAVVLVLVVHAVLDCATATAAVLNVLRITERELAKANHAPVPLPPSSKHANENGNHANGRNGSSKNGSPSRPSANGIKAKAKNQRRKITRS